MAPCWRATSPSAASTADAMARTATSRSDMSVLLRGPVLVPRERHPVRAAPLAAVAALIASESDVALRLQVVRVAVDVAHVVAELGAAGARLRDGHVESLDIVAHHNATTVAVLVAPVADAVGHRNALRIASRSRSSTSAISMCRIEIPELDMM